MTAGIAPDAAHAAAWGDRPPRPRITLVAFKALRRGALHGFATVRLPNGLTISECPVCVTNGRPWAALPSRPAIGRDGRQIEVGGRRQFATILSWPDRATSDRFSAAVVELVRQRHPHSFDDDAAAAA